MMLETGQPTPEPGRRSDNKKAEAEKLEESMKIADADIDESRYADGKMPLETAGESVERMPKEQALADDAADVLTKKIGDLARQKEINAKNTGLSESMAARINAEIDKNIGELQAKLGKKSLKEARIAAMEKRVDAAMLREDEEAEGVFTSAPALETMTRKGGKKKAEKSEGQPGAELDEMRKVREQELDDIEQLVLIREKMRLEAEKAAATEQKKTEEDFFAKGEAIDAAHASGADRSRSAAERRGDAGEERYQMAERAAALRGQRPALEEQLARAERVLRGQGVKDIDETMAKRAAGGFMEQVKGFFGGLFSKKTRELNNAMALYASIRDAYNENMAELNEIDARLNRGEEFRRAMQIKAERKSFTGR